MTTAATARRLRFIKPKSSIVDMAGAIVSRFSAHNALAADQLGPLTALIAQTLTECAGGVAAPAQAAITAPAQVPAVSVRKSITPEYLICLEDGRKMKSMKRYLRAKFDMTPDQYRAKWGLPADYPMVAPAYSETRSALAKEIGLGKNGRGGMPVAPETEAEPVVEAQPEPVVEAPVPEAAPRKGAVQAQAVVLTTEELARVVEEAKANPTATILQDGLICLVDGKVVKDLGRQLARKGLKPDAYRAQFSLPANYPMTLAQATKAA